MRTLAGGPEIDDASYVDNKENPDRTLAPADQVAAFLQARTFFCAAYEARITPEQCATNRATSRQNDYGKFYACLSCPGQAGSAKAKRLSRAGRPPKSDASARSNPPDTPWRQNPGFIPKHRQQACKAEIEPEVTHADPAAVDAPVMPKVMPIIPIIPATPPLQNIKEKEPSMATKKGTCPTCKRDDVSLPFLDKCHRCYDRIKKGKDPLTGEPKVSTTDNSPAAKPATNSQPESRTQSTLQEDVKWGLIKLGYKATDINRALGRTAFNADTTAEEAIKVIINQLSGKGPVKPAAKDAAPAKMETKPAPSAEPAPTFIFQSDPIVRFKGKDKEMLQWLYEQAEFNRRTLEQEILFRIDRSFDGPPGGAVPAERLRR